MTYRLDWLEIVFCMSLSFLGSRLIGSGSGLRVGFCLLCVIALWRSLLPMLIRTLLLLLVSTVETTTLGRKC